MLVMPAPKCRSCDAWACVLIGMHSIWQAHPFHFAERNQRGGSAGANIVSSLRCVTVSRLTSCPCSGTALFGSRVTLQALVRGAWKDKCVEGQVQGQVQGLAYGERGNFLP